MTMVLFFFNAAVCGLISLTLVGAVLHPRVHDGVVIKAGLISMALGFGSIAVRMFDGVPHDDSIHLARSILLVNAGISVVIVGYLWRRARAGHPIRRATDWSDLE